MESINSLKFEHLDLKGHCGEDEDNFLVQASYEYAIMARSSASLPMDLLMLHIIRVIFIKFQRVILLYIEK